ncbi:40S ribosomal protein S23 [Mycena maculata]|uniref:40S ribosomal protein S23 n=1 Tax=Mycena maculata TaxID=230809 RepID=A0AAD7J2H4_9AGAR|nr:40S ribosomal protein S23 [Mycena maculata]
MSSNKPRGLSAARKLRNVRQEGILRDRTYKRRNIYGTSRAANSSYGTGIQLEKVGPKAKQSNSAIRHGVRAHFTGNGNQATVFRFVPTDDGVDLNDNSDVPISPKRKHGALPRAHFKVVKVSGVGILSRWRTSRKVLCLLTLACIATNSS